MQTISNGNARYSFLARPPPQKKKSGQAPPSPPIAIAIPLSTTTDSPTLRHRTSGIAAWAALVQPGSPAPNSPHRRASISSSRRPSLTRRRLSISHSRAPSGALSGLIHSPMSGQDIDIDLGAFGYTSVFVHVPPKTPSTPSHLTRTSMMKIPFTPTATTSSRKPSATGRTIKHFRSLGILRPRSKSTTAARAVVPPSPSKASISGTRARAELISKRKKVKYAHVRPPPPIANEIALMQFADGGSVESNVRALMAAKAVAAGGASGVGDIYRDGKGGMWLDQDEEMEYAHLLGGDVDGEVDSEGQWIRFGDQKSSEDGMSPKTAIADLAGSNDKRESLSTQDSDLSPRYIVLPAEETLCGPEDAVLSFAAPPKSPFGRAHLSTSATTGLSVLSLPSRPNRPAKHLCKPEFLLDMAAFGPRSPKSPHLPVSSFSSPTLPASPTLITTTPIRTSSLKPKTTSARFSSAFVQLPPAPGSGVAKKVKRRPAPLQLASNGAGWRKVEASKSPGSRIMSTSTASIGVVAEARREFVEASFAPQPVIHRVPPATVNTPSANTATTTTRPRGKIIIASLDPREDMARCREWAAASGMMVVDADGELAVDGNTDVDICVSRTTGSVARKKRLGFGGLFGRK
ncbi:hypothetical protein D9756_002197 [Leucocoprinus leucothites]|uniref:Uncharacterized protein n=1 Tax=Leucocoprinus leucothites TaxID=201217 RepID=A0A8H5LM99_9AGAR|nr:hypothetical protein D9756_002197 [Leucoagaricus leucothites]